MGTIMPGDQPRGADESGVTSSAFARVAAALPPDGPDRLIRVLDDARHRELAESLWSLFAATGDKPATDGLLDDIQATTDRLAAEGPFLLRIARALGEEGFEEAFNAAKGLDEEELARFREGVHREHGGILPFVEEQLADFEGTWSRERDQFRVRNEEVVIVENVVPVLLVSDAAHIATGVADIVIGVATVAIGISLGLTPAGLAFDVIGGVEIGIGIAHLKGSFG
jgi:hypothetical protein